MNLLCNFLIFINKVQCSINVINCVFNYLRIHENMNPPIYEISLNFINVVISHRSISLQNPTLLFTKHRLDNKGKPKLFPLRIIFPLANTAG